MYDIIIIGAGVIGAFIARSLSVYKLKICVIDKHIDTAMGTSGANSGIIHAGYDAIPGSLKALLNIEGSKKMEKVCFDLNVPYEKCESLVVAFSDEEKKSLELLMNRGKKGGIKGLSIINKEEIRRLEPNLNHDITWALLAKTAAIVSPYKMTINALENAAINGVEFLKEHEVLDINKDNNIFKVMTSKGKLSGKVVINCAGVFADEIAKMVGDESFKIIPRSGEYILFDKDVGPLVNRVIFQTPTKEGKGVLITKTVDKNILIGPDAKIINDKGLHETHGDVIDYIYKKVLKTTNKIQLNKSITTFTGVRATPESGDFIIKESENCKHFINVAGIDSPGLSSAPAIGDFVLNLVIPMFKKITMKKIYTMTLPKKKYFLNMTVEEKKEAIKNNNQYGKIICRCENVTEAEIVAAIHMKIGATTVDGVKRRTRAGMGRCQGGFCLPQVIDILSRELKIDKEKVQKGDDGSYILTRRTRV
ncbi:MAG: NAD(P)/FAD-dependent oxidoreductase [Clostridiales bacterium]|nr:NAD(P)/FAD-dependent oxidoreductase [Clostridiales bacterium]